MHGIVFYCCITIVEHQGNQVACSSFLMSALRLFNVFSDLQNGCNGNRLAELSASGL